MVNHSNVAQVYEIIIIIIVLILVYYSDSERCMTDSYIKNIIDLGLVREHAAQKIDSLDCSTMTGEGFGTIVSWLQAVGST